MRTKLNDWHSQTVGVIAPELAILIVYVKVFGGLRPAMVLSNERTGKKPSGLSRMPHK